MQKLQKNQKGFTIIEVLIVLAIAGLIMLVVFLAVPALQRNSRNSQRSSEASRIAGGVNECLSNRNGVLASCDALAEINVGTLNALTTVNFATTPPGTAVTGNLTTAHVVYGALCNNTGDGYNAGGGARSFVVVYQIEPAVNRCIGS